MSAEQLSKEIADAVTGVMRKHGHFLDVRTCREVDAEIAARIKPMVDVFSELLHEVDEVADEVLFANPDDAYGFSETLRKAKEVRERWIRSTKQA